MKNAVSVLEINSFCLPVRLGVKKEERKKRQQVCFDISVYFSQLSLKNPDLVFYDKVCERIRNLALSQEFSLIEQLAHKGLEDLKKNLPKNTAVKFSVHKMKAPVKNLKGPVSYTCGFNGDNLQIF